MANPQMTFQRACVFSGIICPLLLLGAFVVAGFVPPLLPSSTAAEIAAHYRDHAAGIRFGASIMLMSGAFYAAYTAVISAQMRRIPTVHRAVVDSQTIAGAFACLIFLVPALFWAVASFRPERPAESTQLLNDMGWIFVLMPWPPFVLQFFAFAFAIFSDTRATPLFPRWLAYVNLWAPITFAPAALLVFFKDGPFAWNGIFVFWLPLIDFVILFGFNVVYLLKAIKNEEVADELRKEATVVGG